MQAGLARVPGLKHPVLLQAALRGVQAIGRGVRTRPECAVLLDASYIRSLALSACTPAASHWFDFTHENGTSGLGLHGCRETSQ